MVGKEFVHQVKIAPTPILREWHKITDTNGRFTSDHKIVFKDSMSLITFHNIHEQKFLQSLLLLLKIFESPSKIIKVYIFTASTVPPWNTVRQVW